MTRNIWAMPSWVSPSRVPTAGSLSPNVISQVVETLRPILCSRLVTLAPLRSPSSPVSRSIWNLGTMNSDRPLVPGPAPSGRASTKWMTLSVMSDSPEVMNRLTPVTFQVPSAFSVALVRPAPTSEPASGSVSTIVQCQPFSTIQWASFFCSSLPRM